MMFTSTGIAHYSPKLNGELSDKWWLVLNTCEGLSSYCRYWWNLGNRGTSTPLYRPAWPSHISVITNETPPRPEFWELYQGQEFTFTYTHDIDFNEQYYWISVRCDRLLDIREELGLPRQPVYPLHLTIGQVM